MTTTLRVLGLFVLGGMVWMPWAKASSPPSPYDTVRGIETALYAKHYPDQPIVTRLNRIETTLIGHVRQGGVPSRIDWADRHIHQLDTQRLTELEQQRTLTFAEKRLLHQANPQAPTRQRLDAIETTLYGQPTTSGGALGDDQPQQQGASLDARLGRLRQSLPLNARTVRLQALPSRSVLCDPVLAPVLAPVPLVLPLPPESVPLSNTRF